ncbi:NAD(P)/FAD-dependent oxidoreductase [Streptomyces mobaraensis NBRC 13819 = DSM 40847]|uniref:Oxidoreductase n=1 Tax=Streptomyces mobaraensis (strain ATCC 29032 / DSM 40847 / JCM 4168 / NBRC 13819 / NCIMB 11159 / IPCR 16-22) TaxID=1223523 RepID=M3A8L2_STRM1|nr:FAD-dependent oxidoreductase [Streptomyces mobaraensis]EMF01484.1 oxidoreductase [Streptomyces mobaraensis NBRC 13819 = DSM 40847]QTT76812.1 NAD(P)/FAD-dependent oxidoreductase [Streptomyces mobaraensis NBRC 13819 = DSM 40847]
MTQSISRWPHASAKRATDEHASDEHASARGPAGRRGRTVVVVGAGPYGLSVAAHLRERGIPVRVFGEVMGSWRHAMATGMYLKSTPAATDLSTPRADGRLADFRRERAEPELTELTPIPCEVFVAYGMWFAARFVDGVDPRRVTSVERDPGGFTVRLDDGEPVPASAVVVATGLGALAHVPGELGGLAPQGPGPDTLLSHTSHHTDLSRYAGMRVAVVGGGQSALESAALLHEAGARPSVLVRAPRVRWGDTPVLERPLLDRLARPASPLGTGWILAGLCAAPQAVSRLPSPARLLIHRRALGPSGGWWLRDRVEGVVPVHTGCRVERADPAGERARLTLTGPGDVPRELVADHVLAATGYRVDLDVLPFLPPPLRGTVVRVPGSGAPRLTGAFESSVPGLYFTGILAAPMFGPMLRFVAGTEFAARRITRHLARHAPRP